MALKEYNENVFPALISTTQKEKTFDSATKGIKVVYINEELDGVFSSQLSYEDWKLLKERMENPQRNQKLIELMKMESVFD